MESAVSTDNLQAIDKEFYLQVFRRYPITLERGEGARVWDDNGNEYIDALAGIAVNSVGHCHPRVVKAVQEQVAKLIHISNFYISEPQAKLAKKLADLSGLDRVFFSNSGAEAVEGAFKLARKYAHKNGRGGTILSIENCFHGRTMATIAAGKRKYQQGFDPIPAGFKQIPFNDLAAMEAAMTDDVAAVIIEPIQGEGGIVPNDPVYMKKLRELCSERNVLLIFDEIQCGIGRTGRFFGYEHYNVKPDLVTMAKALGGGVPIGAIASTQAVNDALDWGDHGTTFGGNPLSCAAGLATIEAIEEENLMDHAWKVGNGSICKIVEASQEEPSITGVRGWGMMIGVQLNFPGKEVVARMLDKKVLANCAAETVIRLVPPLTISAAEMDRVIEVMLESIKAVKEQHQG